MSTWREGNFIHVFLRLPRLNGLVHGIRLCHCCVIWAQLKRCAHGSLKTKPPTRCSARARTKRTSGMASADDDASSTRASSSTAQEPPKDDDFEPLMKALGTSDPSFAEGLLSQIFGASARSNDKFDPKSLFLCLPWQKARIRKMSLLPAAGANSRGPRRSDARRRPGCASGHAARIRIRNPNLGPTCQDLHRAA
jgi:hypothetical protein